MKRHGTKSGATDVQLQPDRNRQDVFAARPPLISLLLVPFRLPAQMTGLAASLDASGHTRLQALRSSLWVVNAGEQ
ncbi:hypothetical protein FJT64_007614 [Amphibalanus amphitrite]|uniref:Uncharacterized protein n=1 Tax=Amphibalanus amphitrite TaxID=1232801 RepID=A0A6A4VEF1_AMPAM|nr:hypothetical protein FJT64_007614 [Amphibalanus amphitrite]